jgi:NAD-dependent dihydropyrimidine dehydrogenase PreA subunit
MAFVITDACTKDFVCTESCSTDAIHPTQEETAAAEAATQLFINPDECIDCGNCAANCPSGAIFSVDELPEDKADFAAKNAAYYN